MDESIYIRCGGCQVFVRPLWQRAPSFSTSPYEATEKPFRNTYVIIA